MVERRARITVVPAWYSRDVDFRKTYYILPNLFTLSSVFCGFISISLSASGQGGSDLYQAALAICFGFFFDTADGRVARLTKTQTELGRDLDSLADLITFGVAPALLVYKWGLTSFGRLGIFIAGLFVCAGAMRLARFNVLSRREEAAGHKNPGKYTLGLAIPAAASVLVFMVLVAHHAGPVQAGQRERRRGRRAGALVLHGVAHPLQVVQGPAADPAHGRAGGDRRRARG